MVDDEMPDQRAHAGLVVTPDVHRPPHGSPGQRDDGDHAGQTRHTRRGQHAVVQDDPVRLAGDPGDTSGGVLVVEADRAHQHVEATALRGNVDAAIDDVDEKQAFVLVFEMRFVAAAKDNTDDLFQSVGERTRRAVGHEAELGHRAHDALTGARSRSALTVQDPRDRRDRNAGPARDVIYRQRTFWPFRFGHSVWLQPTGDWLCKRLPVSAYRIIWTSWILSRLQIGGGAAGYFARLTPAVRIWVPWA